MVEILNKYGGWPCVVGKNVTIKCGSCCVVLMKRKLQFSTYVQVMIGTVNIGIG